MRGNPARHRVVELLLAPLKFWGVVAGVLLVFFAASVYLGSYLCLRYIRSTMVEIRDIRSCRSVLSRLPLRQTERGWEREFVGAQAPPTPEVAVIVDATPKPGAPAPGQPIYAMVVGKDEEEEKKDREAEQAQELELEREIKLRQVGIREAAGAPRRYSADLGEFFDEEQARALVQRLRQRGHAAYLETVKTDRGPALRVRVGAFGSEMEARALEEELAREGFVPPAPPPPPAEPEIAGPSGGAPTPEPSPAPEARPAEPPPPEQTPQPEGTPRPVTDL